MNTDLSAGCTAFADTRQISSGAIENVAIAVKRLIDQGSTATVLIFDNQNSQPIELDFRGTESEFALRLQNQFRTVKGPGRPKLGVVAREVTLLPVHWEWLNSQPGGASVALRKLVEVARKSNDQKDNLRQAQEATYRFMSAIAGNFSNFEEATRALFAAKSEDFEQNIAGWPEDVRVHTLKISQECFAQKTT